MVFDKLIAKVIDKEIKRDLSPNQHGARENKNTMTAKLQLLYTMNQKGYNKILLIDLKKAFDLVDHNILLQSIEETIKDQNDKLILKNIFKIYKSININIEDTDIHSTRGVPQGSVFGPTMFLLVIDDLMNKLQSYHNIHIQAFVDDIAIAGKETKNLQQAYNIIKKIITQKSMEINVDKCELITDNQEDHIIDEENNQPLNTVKCAKYLGQSIDNNGNTEDIILRRNYQSISQLIHVSQTFITLRSRIKLFQIYIRTKYNHLLPIIALKGDINKTWNEIRKSIFNDLLKRSTQPKESATLLGCSCYSIIIKPILKLIQQASDNHDNNQKEFLIEAAQKAFIHWTEAEQNHDQQVINHIKNFIQDKKTIPINQWNHIIKEEAIKRLFKNTQIPEEITNLKDLKHPRLIEALSNAPKHIIEAIINKYIKSDYNQEQFKIHIRKQLHTIITLCSIDEDNPPQIQKPYDTNNIEELIEYQQLIDLHITDRAMEINEINMKQIDDITEELKNLNNNKNKEIDLGPKLRSAIQWLKENIPKWKKDKYDYAENILEKSWAINTQNNIQNKQPKKNRPGRPKKQKEKNPDPNQNTLENYMDIIEN